MKFVDLWFPGFLEPTTDDLVDQRLQDGATVQQVADEIGRGYYATLNLIHRLGIVMPPRRGRIRSDETDAEIMRLLRTTDLSQREIARRTNCSQHAVHCRYKRIKNQRRNEADTVGDFMPLETKTRRCPTHGLVNVWPCVACAAVGATVSA